MKLLAVIGGLIMVCLVWWWFLSPRSTPVSPAGAPSPTQKISPTPMPPLNATLIEGISLNTIRYTMFGQEIPRGTTVSLIANFARRESGQQLVQSNHCQMGINGGFYTKEQLPLGWFVSEGSTAGQLIDSTLVTGFFWQDKQGKRYISRQAPEKESIDFVFQTGPYIEVGDTPLHLVSDEASRRSLLGVDEQNKLYVLSITEASNTFSGPNLADIPVLFNKPEVQQKIPFRTLLNLDGGTASFFYVAHDNQSFVLSELSPIGSLICAR